MSLDLDGRFFTASTKGIARRADAEEGHLESLGISRGEFVDSTKIRVTIPWPYLASPRKLVLWPFNLDEVEAAQGNGLPLNGTEQKISARRRRAGNSFTSQAPQAPC